MFGSELGRELEALRYRAYTLERAVALGSASRDKLVSAQLYVLLTRAQCVAALDWTIREAARGGADVFQLREKTMPDRELLTLARDVRKWTREAGVLFVVNDRPDVARLCEADGVHLGQDDMSVKDARRIAGPDVLIGVSTHSVEQLRAALLDGADYVGIGPTFPSKNEVVRPLPRPGFRAGSGRGDFAPRVCPRRNRAGERGASCCRGGVPNRREFGGLRADDPGQAARLLKAALVN